jgi:preprotein translocase subunit SecE
MNIFKFFSEVKSELLKVIWPTKGETFRYTLTVIIFSIVVALVLGAFDYLLLRIFEAIVNR